MEKTTKVMESSDLHRKIDALGLPARQRQQAMASADVVERLVYGVDGLLKLLKVVPAASVAPQQKFRPQ